MRIKEPRSRVFTLDPGVRGCGLAYWIDGDLWAAWYVRNPCRTDCRGAASNAMGLALATAVQGYTWDAVAVEWPVQRKGAGNFANRDDISDLTAVAAAAAFVLGQGADLHTPSPEQWKGQTPKHIHTARVVGGAVAAQRLRVGTAPRGFVSKAPGLLSAAELERVRWGRNKKLNVDVVDAVGIGLWYYGRSR